MTAEELTNAFKGHRRNELLAEACRERERGANLLHFYGLLLVARDTGLRPKQIAAALNDVEWEELGFTPGAPRWEPWTPQKVGMMTRQAEELSPYLLEKALEWLS